MAKRDYYEVLGVSKTATEEEIKKAYRKLAMANHPDTHPGDKAAEDRFKEATEAYEVLADKTKRQNYDQFGFAGVDGQTGGYGRAAQDFSDIFSGMGGGFGDIFDQIFGGGFGGRATSRGQAKGSSLQYEVSISLKDAVFGTTVSVSYNHEVACDSCGGTGGSGNRACPTCGGRGQVARGNGFFSVASTCPTCGGTGRVVEHPCDHCHGSGTMRKKDTYSVTIPAGVEDGMKLALRGKGNAAPNGGIPGDLFVVINVKDDRNFEREGYDLYIQIPVSFTQAALGGEIEAPTIDGTKVKVRIPQGIQSGKRLRVRGYGVPKGGRGALADNRGDMYIIIIVQTPRITLLNVKAKKALEDLSAALGGENQAPDPIPFES